MRQVTDIDLPLRQHIEKQLDENLVVLYLGELESNAIEYNSKNDFDNLMENEEFDKIFTASCRKVFALAKNQGIDDRISEEEFAKLFVKEQNEESEILVNNMKKYWNR